MAAEQPDGAATEDRGAGALEDLRVGRIAQPRQSSLDGEVLAQPLLRDAERFREHRDIAQFLRHAAEVAHILHDHLRGKSVEPLDAAFAVVTRRAEVAVAAAACGAVVVRARATHRRHHEVAGPEVRHVLAGVHHLAEPLMSGYQEVVAVRRRAVVAAADAAVGAANTHLDHADQDAGRGVELRRVDVADLAAFAAGCDRTAFICAVPVLSRESCHGGGRTQRRRQGRRACVVPGDSAHVDARRVRVEARRAGSTPGQARGMGRDCRYWPCSCRSSTCTAVSSCWSRPPLTTWYSFMTRYSGAVSQFSR
jgi:hypothetical protein